jgi:glycosyltransferase involved in cell wall biosynthesis
MKGYGVFVFPSIYETLGITPLEALLSGVRVICTDSPRWVGAASFISAEDRFDLNVSSLKTKIAGMRGNTSLYGRLGLRIGLEEFFYDFEHYLGAIVQSGFE